MNHGYEVYCTYIHPNSEFRGSLLLINTEAKWFIYYIYTTFTPHFKGKRGYISGIITLLSVLRNALMRNGGSIYKLIPPTSDITCIYYLLFSVMYSKHSQKSFDCFDETVNSVHYFSLFMASKSKYFSALELSLYCCFDTWWDVTHA